MVHRASRPRTTEVSTIDQMGSPIQRRDMAPLVVYHVLLLIWYFIFYTDLGSTAGPRGRDPRIPVRGPRVPRQVLRPAAPPVRGSTASPQTRGSTIPRLPATPRLHGPAAHGSAAHRGSMTRGPPSPQIRGPQPMTVRGPVQFRADPCSTRPRWVCHGPGGQWHPT